MDSTTDKHAFLILAHKDDLVFRTLISMLDHPLNDIYIHMDEKTKSYNPNEIKSLTKYSNVYHCPRTKVSWGGYNQINAELLLLKEAAKNNYYAYYHLLSGQDLPIKSQTEIHNFFKNNQGKEFISFDQPTFSYEERIRYYYLLQEKIGKTGTLPMRIANKILIETQKILHVHRNRNKKFQKGSNWFSITDALANYIIEKEPWIKKTFKYTTCCDEIFLHSIVDNSEFKNRLYHKEYNDNPSANMRLIDWNRGTPYIFKSCDIDEIKNSKYLFARKFDSSVDEKIVTDIQNLLLKPNPGS